MHKTNLRAVAEFLIVAVCTLALALTVAGICGSLLARNSVGSRDFVEYWASGHLLIHRANPYDGEAILRLERSVGYPAGFSPEIMANLPTALPLVLPLGFLGPAVGEFLWLLLLIVSLVASVRMVWALHGRPKNHLNFLGYTFAPALSCLHAGQVTIFLLLGLVLFLRLNRSWPFLAGLSLWLCMLKPHIFMPFGVVLLTWAILNRGYRFLLGCAVALGVSTAIALILDPLVWVQYGQMMSTERLESRFIPCLSVMLRRAVSPHPLWLQCLPVTLGCIWALTYFREHRKHWNWMEHGSLLMLVSVLVAPYTWFMDQVIAIPALLHAAYFTRSRSLLAVLALASAVIEIAKLRGASLLHSSFYVWTAPAWIAWYLCAIKTPCAVEDRGSALAQSPVAEVLWH